MKRITILLRPTEECNFRCQYCYHADTNYEKGKMSIELFKEIIGKTVSKYNDINLIFHGGEPLLMGYDFFEKALDIINAHKRSGINWRIGIQTNGYLLDEEMCELLVRNEIYPSISFDGPGELNCLRDKTDKVTENIINLRGKGYPINILGVITQKNVKYLRDFYEFAKKNGCPCKLNPVFESGGAKGQNHFLISPEDYIEAIKSLFYIWINDETSESAFDPLSSLTYMALSYRHAPICEYCGCLHKWIAIGHDGSMYPCSRSYPKNYYLGNIKEVDCLSKAFEHKNFVNLIIGAIERRNYCKNSCSYYNLCQGGCNNDSILHGNLTRPTGFKCEVFKTIIPHIREYILEHRDEIRNKQVVELIRKYQDGEHND